MAPNDIYILSSYIAGAVVLVVLAWASYETRRRNKNILRKLEQQIGVISEKQGQ